jgi:hypothetical protein
MDGTFRVKLGLIVKCSARFHTQTSLEAILFFIKRGWKKYEFNELRFDHKEANKNIVRKLAQFPRLLQKYFIAVIEASGVCRQFAFA